MDAICVCMISLLNITQIVYLTTQQLFMPLHKADQILCQLYIQNLGKSIFSIKYQVNPLNNCFIIFNSIVDITLSQYIYSMSKTVCIQVRARIIHEEGSCQNWLLQQQLYLLCEVHAFAALGKHYP